MDKGFIVNALRKNGVQEGMCLEVHSSLKSFGYVEGGAETVISALKESVGSEGTIFMPALRLSPALPLTDEDKKLGISCKIKILPDDRKKSAMGIIADTFRLQDGTLTGSGIMIVSNLVRNFIPEKSHKSIMLRQTESPFELLLNRHSCSSSQSASLLNTQADSLLSA